MAAVPDRMDPRPPPAEQAAGDARAGASGAAAGRSLLFLREEELRLAQDLLFFGYRDFTAGADAVLAELGMGRAHHRVLHFVGRRPGITVGELLGILGITKQSLGRVLTPLVEGGHVRASAGRNDRYDYLYSEDELREWIAKIKDMSQKARKTFVFFNNCHAGQAATNARLMKELLSLPF